MHICTCAQGRHTYVVGGVQEKMHYYSLAHEFTCAGWPFNVLEGRSGSGLNIPADRAGLSGMVRLQCLGIPVQRSQQYVAVTQQSVAVTQQYVAVRGMCRCVHAISVPCTCKMVPYMCGAVRCVSMR